MLHRTLFALTCAIVSVSLIGCEEFTGEDVPQGTTTIGSSRSSGGSSLESKPEKDEVTEIPPEVLDYFHRSVAERKRLQRQLRSEITELKRRRRTVRAADQQQVIDDEIAKRQAKIEELDGEFPVPPMNLARLHEGELGGIGRVYVVDVREGSTALVCQSTDLSRENIVMLKLLSFVNMKVGEERIFQNPFEVTGTEKIPRPRGGERSVFVLKVKRDFQLDPYKPLYVKLHPQSSGAEPVSTETPTVTSSEPSDPSSPTPEPAPIDKKQDEEAAAGKLKLAKVFVEKRNTAVAKKRLQAIVDDYPETKAAGEAKTLLEGLE